MEIKLPTSKVPAEQSSPRNLVIFSKPKTGKTTLLSQLDNCLILDLEKGSKYVDAMKVEAHSIEEIKQIGKAITEAGNPYKYIAVDTITALEEMCIPYAEQLYMKTPMGKNWPTDGKLKYGTIIGLPNGAGYQYLREAFTKAIAYIQTWAPRIILVGHVKDTMLEKDGAEFNSLDLDLTGKLKRITASNSDSIGYLYRKGKKNILSFKTSDEIACGARPKHLSNQEIVLSEVDSEGNITTNWDKIYID
jgi:energy-coupling factor transporter ATP-binding protein EcfA2